MGKARRESRRGVSLDVDLRLPRVIIVTEAHPLMRREVKRQDKRKRVSSTASLDFSRRERTSTRYDHDLCNIRNESLSISAWI